MSLGYCKSAALMAVSASAVLASASQAAVVYTQDFNLVTPAPGNTNGAVAPNTGTPAWSAYLGTGAADVSNTAATGGDPKIAISNLNGVGGTSGYLFTNDSVEPAQQYIAVGSLSAPVAATSIAWKMSNTLPSADYNIDVRLMVRVGSNWYATSTDFTDATDTSVSGQGATVLQAGNHVNSYAFSTAAADWRSLVLNPGTEATLGSVLGAPLPSNEIDGVGFFVAFDAGSTTSTTVRLDNLTIDGTVIPEPASLAAVGFVSLAMLRRRRD